MYNMVMLLRYVGTACHRTRIVRGELSGHEQLVRVVTLKSLLLIHKRQIHLKFAIGHERRWGYAFTIQRGRRMWAPSGRERVSVAGQPGVYLVVWIDARKQRVDLIPLDGGDFIREGVAFSELQPCSESTPRQWLGLPLCRCLQCSRCRNSRVFAGSEQEFQAELNLAVGGDGRSDISRGSHCSARSGKHGAVGDWRREVGVVEDVIELGAELKLHPDRCRRGIDVVFMAEKSSEFNDGPSNEFLPALPYTVVPSALGVGKVKQLRLM